MYATVKGQYYRKWIKYSSIFFRLCLAYGGSDVSRCFYWLMQRAGFPYRDCQLTNKLDCLLLQHLKETFCHLDQVRKENCLFFFSSIECYAREPLHESTIACKWKKHIEWLEHNATVQKMHDFFQWKVVFVHTVCFIFNIE